MMEPYCQTDSVFVLVVIAYDLYASLLMVVGLGGGGRRLTGIKVTGKIK
jgi:hypothetical protein